MAIRFKRVQRLCDPTNKEAGKKVYPVISYQYDTSATLDEFAKEISSASGVSEGETISVLKDFRTLLRKTLLSGRSVNIAGLGYFYLAAQSKGTEKAEDFTVSDISGLRVCFRANSDIRLFTGTSTRSDGLKFKDLDHINDSMVAQAKEVKHRTLMKVREVVVKHPIRQLDKREVGN
jgi:predicted histone-like DNA-binding protein